MYKKCSDLRFVICASLSNFRAVVCVELCNICSCVEWFQPGNNTVSVVFTFLECGWRSSELSAACSVLWELQRLGLVRFCNSEINGMLSRVKCLALREGKLHKEELHYFFSPNIIRKVRWVGRVENMDKNQCMQSFDWET